MAIGYAALGSIDSGKTSGSSLTITTTSAVPKGATVIVRHGFDNNAAGSATVSAPAPGTLTCSVAGAVTGATVRAQLNSGSASAAGVALNLWTFVAGAIIPSGSTITVTVGASVTSRVASAAWIGADWASTTTSRATTGAASVSATPIAATQAAVATVVGEDNVAQAFGSVAGWTMGTQDGTTGGNAATNVVIVSARKVPVGAVTAQTFNPSGTYAGGDWVASMMLFNDTSPAVSSISPSSAGNSVAQSITITGTYFTDVTSVMLGATSLAYTVNSATQITATVPADFPAGAHTLVVYARGSQSDGDTYTSTSTTKVVDVPLLGAPGAVATPAVLPGPVSVVAPLVVTSTTTHAPATTVGPVTAFASTCAQPATVRTPGVLATYTVAAPALLAAPATTLTPVAQPGPVTAVVSSAVASPATVRTPAALPGAVTAGFVLLASGALVYSPGVAQGVSPPLLTDTAIVHTPPMMWMGVDVTVVVPHIYT